MPKQFDLLVFDWDGTLMDSAATIVAAIQAASRDIGADEPSEAAARHIIGLGLNEAIAALFPDMAAADYSRLADRYRVHFMAQDAEIPLFAGAEEAIRELHAAGFMLAVATGKGRHGLDRVLDHTGLRPYFHATRCADESFSKPHPQMLLELMERLDASPDKTLMIGDTSHDLQMAVNAGVPSLGAAYGAHPREGLVGFAPLACADTFGELHQWLRENA
ncbi:MAG: HAD-IA family hydrolase [Sulfurimicrobium sp.]|jgi:phosphoglycolate phosphatase|nr:HAD-IA family hydrolase [Sulfurimicrobium sp.]MDP1703760.1 HAD-IA family hydrolase [Sulfurimicrobium sp.]MDP2170331.1 HAD-IA family hydrolase [Rhodocyclaceae bacterium]MDP2962933.1 HAD-IA family hydrolase [Sulfurimicrobium sp.]MDZ7655434.1 HAD-IA family hydrolase [Sulfurimicrobium sp.]